MKRFSIFLVFFALMTASTVCRAQTTFGEVAATLPINAAKLVADPARNRVYAVVTASNSVVGIDTTTFLTTTIPVGSQPVDMSISPDDATLYVANSGSSVAAISVVDLNTLTTVDSIPLPGAAQTVVAGPSGRLYVKLTNSSLLFQVDVATGTAQTPFGANFYGTPLLLGSDGKTLYVSESLRTFDVSTTTPIRLLTSQNYGGDQLVVSHNGQYFCTPNGSNSGVTSTSTSLYSTTDLTSIYGSFSSVYSPGPLVFSLDDSMVYQYRSGAKTVFDVFSTQNFSQLQEVTLSPPGSTGNVYSVGSLVMDYTGSYLFFIETYYDSSFNYVTSTVILTTGAGPLTPSTIPPAITSSLSAAGSQHTPFLYQITASNTPTSFNATSLPAGLTVNTTTGLISGTPTSYGTSSVKISASNASGIATATLALSIAYDSPYVPPVINPTSLPDGVISQAYTATISATHSPYSFAAVGLPSGLSINTYNGVISGTPVRAGNYSVTFTVTNDYGFDTITLPLIVTTVAVAAPVITSAPTAIGTVGAAFTYQTTASGTPTTYSATGLPTGLSITASSGLIHGTPLVAGTFSVVLGATNAGGTGARTLTLTVAAVAVAPPVITSPGTATGTMGQPFSFQVAASNGPTSFAASGLPQGLGIETGTGLISGTPLAQGVFPVMLGATNATGTDTATLVLTIASNVPPVVTSSGTATATEGQPFSYQITASNDPTDFAASSLPPGVTVDAATGLISGTPLASGTFKVVLSVTNPSGTNIALLTLTVASNLPIIELFAVVPRVTAGSGDQAAITISRTGDLSRKITVAYSLKGSARNGTDYVLLSGRQKIKANKASATIQIIPKGNVSDGVIRTIKVTLLPATESYQLGGNAKAKIKILPAE